LDTAADSLLRSNPFSIELMENPLPFYKALRDYAPVRYYEEYDTYFFSRFEHVWEVLRVGDNTFVATETNLPTPKYLRTTRNNGAPSFASTNPMAPGPSLPSPFYEEMRLAHIAPLRPTSVAALREFIQSVVQKRLKELIARKKFDLVSDYAATLAATVVAHLFGIELSRAGDLLRTVSQITRFDPLKEGVDFTVFFRELKSQIVPSIQARRLAGADGSNGLIDGLVNYRTSDDARALSDNEISDQLACVMIAGMESASKVTAQGIMELWTRPEQLAAVRADPTKNVPIAVQEMVRFCAPAQYTFRTAHKDVTVGGQHIKAGQRIACLLRSASRDEREFRDPDSFIWNRPIDRVISFGLGQHHCIGKHLALLEIKTLVQEFLSKVKSAEFVMEEAERNPSCFQWGWIGLPVVVEAY
jgi:cytochrome P450